MTLSTVSPQRVAELYSQRMLCLFGGPYLLQHGRRFSVPEGSQRLIVYVALHGGRVDRRQMAGTLWPEGGDVRAAGNLRSALWRLKATGADVLDADRNGLALGPDTQVDVHRLDRWAGRVIDGSADDDELSPAGMQLDPTDLLPGWYDDWVIFERERIRQRVLHALECVSARRRAAGRFGEAVESALLAVKLEPLRESAQRALIEAHIAEGNLVEARRSLATYSRLLDDELGLRPGPELQRLALPHPRVAPVGGDARR